MELKEFAQMIDGKQYGYPQFTKKELQIAKDNGFVIVYGASDDLMEFGGAVEDEIGCFNGGKAWICRNRTTYGLITDDCRCIEAVWCDGMNSDGIPADWTYKTDIPCERFNIWEDGECYCVGLVFSIEDLK